MVDHSPHVHARLARVDTEYIATKRIRTRRLKNEPEGFFLNDGGRGYTCGICRNNHNGEDIWWRPDGLRCRDCWRNIQEDVIPMLDLDKERWEREFLTKFDLTYDFKIHPSSIRKLRKEGILIGRDLKDPARYAYETVYLVSENQEFLEKYPKKQKS